MNTIDIILLILFGFILLDGVESQRSDIKDLKQAIETIRE